jgi:predicted helicase
MYARFFRWASSRLTNKGILAFVTNSSFLEARTFDGFRKVVAEEFNEIYVIDLGGDVRKNPKLSGTQNNVFGIQTGVAISFMIKKEPATLCKIYYARRPEMETAADKLAFLAKTKLRQIEFERVTPDKNHNWLNIVENDFEELLPLANKETKRAQSQTEEKAVFKLYSLGVLTARDEWVYDFNEQNLIEKVKFFGDFYQREQTRWNQSDKKDQNLSINDWIDRTLKWTSELKAHLLKNTPLKYNPNCLRQGMYRPFVKKYFYFDEMIIHRLYQLKSIFRLGDVWSAKQRFVPITLEKEDNRA